MHRNIVVAAVMLAVTACTPTQAPGGQAAAGTSGRQCFLASQVNSFHPIDRDTVLVRTGASTYYQLDILGTCPDFDWSNRIGIRSTGGGSWVCRGQDAELIVPSPTGFDRCPVLGVRLLTAEEAKAARAQ
jgi:hypothetical protein